MAISSKTALRSAKDLKGDARELARRLGTPDDLAGLGAALALGSTTVMDAASLRQFLSVYVTTALIPVELPLVRQSFEYAARGAMRELIALDRQHAPAGVAASLAEASQGVGRTHLRQMRPLRGERRVQQYWRAVQRGEARAWHSLVYGLVFAVYGLPLRQGLVSFGAQTIRGFVHASQRRLGLDGAVSHEIESEFVAFVPPAVEHVLVGTQGTRLLAI
jgi:urease accessory protein UreF